MTTDDPHPTDSHPTTGDADPWTPAADRASHQRSTADSGDPEKDGVAHARRLRWLLNSAIVVFSIGAVFTVLAAATPFVINRDAPTVLYVVAMICAPVGFLLALLYTALIWRLPRERQRN